MRRRLIRFTSIVWNVAFNKLRYPRVYYQISMSRVSFFDVHTHTQFTAFSQDQDAVVQRALDAGVWMVNVGTQKDTSSAAVETAKKYKEGVYAAVGLHPIHTEKSYHDSKELGDSDEARGFTSRGEEFDYEYYMNLAQDSKVVAIGECGLDYFRLGEETKNKQKETFIRQIELSIDINKPLMIHCRRGFSDLISILNSKTHNLKPGIIHFFTGTKDDAKKLLDLNFSFSFGGVITFTRDYDEVVKYIPLEKILFETDAPYVTPLPYRGRRNEPAYVIEVAKKVAELKKVEYDKICITTFQNALAIFNCKI